jgi:hypothetical protein
MSNKTKYVGMALGILFVIFVVVMMASDEYRAAAIVVTGFAFVGIALFAAFAAGIGVAGQLMRQGAEIALKAQESDDLRDTALLNAQTQMVTTLLPKVMKAQQGSLQEGRSSVPLLAEIPDYEDADFTIGGL